jgi:hypothetical protein
MGSNPIISQKRVDDAAKATKEIYQKIQEESAENRRTYERFYNNLALFSGATVALSITYLGYLKGLQKPVAHQGLLVESWAALLACLTLSTFYAFFNAHYMHYGRHREYLEALKDQRETEANELGNLNIVNLRSPGERFMVERRLRGAAEQRGKDIKWAHRRESVYSFVWIWSGRLARLAFVAGLGLLFAFAVGNI